MFFNGGFYVGFILIGNEHREREREIKKCVLNFRRSQF